MWSNLFHSLIFKSYAPLFQETKNEVHQIQGNLLPTHPHQSIAEEDGG